MAYENNAFTVRKIKNTQSGPTRHPYFVWDAHFGNTKLGNNRPQRNTDRYWEYGGPSSAHHSEKHDKLLKVTEFVTAQQWYYMQTALGSIGIISKHKSQNGNTNDKCFSNREVQTDPAIKEKLLNIAVQTDPVLVTNEFEEKLKKIASQEKLDDKDTVSCKSLNRPSNTNIDALKIKNFMRRKTILETIKQLSRLSSIIESINKDVVESTRNKKNHIINVQNFPQIEKKVKPAPLTEKVENDRQKSKESDNREPKAVRKTLSNVTSTTNNAAMKFNNLMYTYNPYKK